MYFSTKLKNQQITHEKFPPYFNEMPKIDVLCAVFGAKNGRFSLKSVDFGLFCAKNKANKDHIIQLFNGQKVRTA